MSPRTVNPRIHAARRDEFIDAGQRLIQTRGYEQFSVEDLLAEVGASKGAFYHYFDSKTALLEAIVDRFVEVALVEVEKIVRDDSLKAMDKFHAYFSTIARLKGEQKQLLLPLLHIWYSDDNALVRAKLRGEQVRLVTEHIASIVRQGVAEGVFTLADPDAMARVLLSLILDTGDEAGELFMKREAGEVDLATVRRRLQTYQVALERVLGVPLGTLQLMDEVTLQTWFG
jgi:AcrR family transcriptional regulator